MAEDIATNMSSVSIIVDEDELDAVVPGQKGAVEPSQPSDPEAQMKALLEAQNKRRTGGPKHGEPRRPPRKQINFKLPQELATIFSELSIATGKPKVELMEEAIFYLKRKYERR